MASPQAAKPPGDPGREARFAVLAFAGLLLLPALLVFARGQGPLPIHVLALYAAPGFGLLVAGLIGIAITRHGHLTRNAAALVMGGLIAVAATVTLLGIEVEPYDPGGRGGDSRISSLIDVQGQDWSYSIIVPGTLPVAAAQAEPPVLEAGNATHLRVTLSWTPSLDPPDLVRTTAQRWDGVAWTELYGNGLQSGQNWTWGAQEPLGRIRIVLEREGGVSDQEVRVEVASFRKLVETCVWHAGMDLDGPPASCTREAPAPS